MKIPNDEKEKRAFLYWIIEMCTSSQQQRRAQYDKRRLYYLFGQNIYKPVRLNKLESHLGLVSSFIYSPDGLSYNIAAPPNAEDDQIQKFIALQDEWNEEVQDSSLADTISEAVTWSLVYDTMVIKLGWNDFTGRLFPQIVEPYSFGVFREDQSDFSSQQAMCHSFIIDYDEAVERLTRAGLKDQIRNLKFLGGQADTGLPSGLNQMIISATGGANLAGNIVGEISPDYDAATTYVPTLNNPVCRFHEVWIWDSDANDWRIFHCADPDIIISDSKETIEALSKGNGVKKNYASPTNFFIKGENPFTPITPYPLYNYFWGKCHLESLIPLQNWMTERLTQIDEILQRQADPARVFSGFMGLLDEKANAMRGPGAWVADQAPGASVKELAPQMPPDLFSEVNEINGLFLEQSGLTEILTGKSSGGARGGAQNKQLQSTGGGRIRRVAVGLERALVRIGDMGLKLKMRNDDNPMKTVTGEEFVAAQLCPDYTMRVAGHAQSPLFRGETHDIALTLFKAQAIDREQLIRSLNPSAKDSMIHSLRARMKAEQAAKQQELAMGVQPKKKGG